MPRYGDAREVAVQWKESSKWLYGFRTKADSADSTVLGHVPVVAGATVEKPVLFGVNNVRPARASKVKASGTDSSYVGADKVAAAIAANWKVTNGRVTVRRPSARVKIVKVKLATDVFLGWPIPQETYDKTTAAARTANGMVDAAINDDDLAFGLNSIILPNGNRATRKDLRARYPYGDAGKYVTSYAALDKTPATVGNE